MCCTRENCSGKNNPKFQEFLEHALVAAGKSVREAKKQAERNFDYFSVRCKHRKIVNYRKNLTAPGCKLKKSPFDWGCSLNACPLVEDGVYSWCFIKK